MTADICYHFSCTAGPANHALRPVSFAVNPETAQALREADGTPQALEAVMPRIREALGIPTDVVVVAQATLAAVKR